MKVKAKYVWFAILCMFVTPIITHADCDYQRQAELSRLASNVQLAYIYTDNQFTIYMTNLSSDLYVTDMYGRVFRGDGNEKTFKSYSGNVYFDIYSNDNNCYGEKLLRKSINLPTLNSFISRDECSLYPNFKYCSAWGEYSISDEQFMSELAEYKQELNKSIEAQKGEKVTIGKTIIDVLKDNLFMFIFLGIIIVLTLIIAFVKKKIRK